MISFESIRFAFLQSNKKLNLTIEKQASVRLLNERRLRASDRCCWSFFQCNFFRARIFTTFQKHKSQRFISNGRHFLFTLSVHFTRLCWRNDLCKNQFWTPVFVFVMPQTEHFTFRTYEWKCDWVKHGVFAARGEVTRQREIHFYSTLFTLWYRAQWSTTKYWHKIWHTLYAHYFLFIFNEFSFVDEL